MKNVQQYAARAGAVAVLVALSIPFANAQPRGLHMEVGFSERLEIPGEVANVVVGAPTIVDVLPITANVYVLNATSLGTTNIVAVDENGRQIYYERIVVRPVDLSPRFEIFVNDRRYLCDQVRGCPPGGLEAARPVDVDVEDQPE